MSFVKWITSSEAHTKSSRTKPPLILPRRPQLTWALRKRPLVSDCSGRWQAEQHDALQNMPVVK